VLMYQPLGRLTETKSWPASARTPDLFDGPRTDQTWLATTPIDQGFGCTMKTAVGPIPQCPVPSSRAVAVGLFRAGHLVRVERGLNARGGRRRLSVHGRGCAEAIS
jgi:hypothetical protein